MRVCNPVLPGFHADPTICRVGEDFYLATSSFAYFPGIPLYHSRDLAHWRPIGFALDRPEQLNLSTVRSDHGLYAPTLRHHDGVFYLVTTLVGGPGHLLLTARDPAGPWSDPIWLGNGGIDPSLFFDDDGTVYFTCTGSGRIRQALLDVKAGRLGEYRDLAHGTGGSYPEGPHLYRRGDWYYLLMSEGGTEYCHMVTLARSRSAWGPWEWAPHNPVLSHRSAAHAVQSVGHADWVEDAEGRTWAVCLGVRPQGYPSCHHLGRETFLCPVEWSEEDWPVFGIQGRVPLEFEKPGPAAPWPAASGRADFSTGRLGPEWLFLRRADPSRHTLTERPGWLRLHGGEGTLDGSSAPAWVGRRQTQFHCRFLARVELRGGGEAGLTAYMNERHHYEIFLLDEAEGRSLAVRRRIGSLQAIVARMPAPAGPVELAIEAASDAYQFNWWDPAQRAWQLLATGETRYLSTEVAGGFTGVFLGLYATEGTADFDRVEYVVLS